MEQNIVITNSEQHIGRFLNDGWLIKSITAQYVSASGNAYGNAEGKFCFLIERE